MSTAAPWLNHQNSFALLNGLPRSFARLRAVSYSGSAWISRFDCCQKRTSLVSRKSQPLATTPCSLGQLAGQQRRLGRAGDGGQHLRHVRRPSPASAIAFSRGACSSSRGVRPTALISTMGCIGNHRQGDATMQTRRLGNSDLHITPDRLRRVGHRRRRVGVRLGRQDDADSVATIREALDLGINWIDTAAVYGLGHSEEVVAKALEGVEQAALRVHQVRPGVGREPADRQAPQGREHPPRVRGEPASG